MLLVQLVGYELRELADGPIDLRLVTELVEVLGDWRVREIPLDDESFFDIEAQWVLFCNVLGARRI